MIMIQVWDFMTLYLWSLRQFLAPTSPEIDNYVTTLAETVNLSKISTFLTDNHHLLMNIKLICYVHNPLFDAGEQRNKDVFYLELFCRVKNNRPFLNDRFGQSRSK